MADRIIRTFVDGEQRVFIVEFDGDTRPSILAIPEEHFANRTRAELQEMAIMRLRAMRAEARGQRTAEVTDDPFVGSVD